MRTLFLAYLLLTTTFNISAETSINCSKRDTLSFGLVPMTSADLMLVWTSRFNRQIQEHSCIKLSSSSTADFKSFILKANEGVFDIVAVPGHFASYLMSTSGFKPVAGVEWEFNYLYAVPVDSTISSIDQIDGTTFALPDPLADASIFIRNKMSNSHDMIRYQHYKNYNQIAQALLHSRVDVGVFPSPFYNAYVSHMKNKIRVIHTVQRPSKAMLLAAPHISEQSRADFLNILGSIKPGSGLFRESYVPISTAWVEELHRSRAASVAAIKVLVDND